MLKWVVFRRIFILALAIFTVIVTFGFNENFSGNLRIFLNRNSISKNTTFELFHQNNTSDAKWTTDFNEWTTVPSLNGLNSNVLVSHYQRAFTFTTNCPQICNGTDVSLLIVVTSAIRNIDARDAIRHTWGGHARERGAKMVFLLGQTVDAKDNRAILDENFITKDIVQANFVDHYGNLTLKTVSLLKWVSDYCTEAEFVLKTDDDIFLNVDLLLEFLNSHPDLRNTIVGKVAKRWTPHRNLMDKWYVSEKILPDTRFPDFATGPAYLLTGDAVGSLYETSLDLPLFQLEDVFMTGFVAEIAGVELLNNPQMRNRPMKLNKCKFANVMTVHKCNPERIEDLWVEVHRKSPKCKKKFRKKH